MSVIPTFQEGSELNNLFMAHSIVDRIQLAGNFDNNLASASIGKFIRIRGTLFPGHAGWHVTQVLLDVLELSPLPDDKPCAVLVSYGSAFLVGDGRHVITNFHVVSGKLGITTSFKWVGKARARLVDFDKANDLALLELGMRDPSKAAMAIRDKTLPTLGEAVYLFGYPLQSKLAEALNMSNGIVSAESGIGGSLSQFQFSCPMGPGHSGGPLLDQYGNILGAAVMTLEMLGKWDSRFPQNFNFAIQGHTIAEFLKKNGLESMRSKSYRQMSIREIANIGKAITIPVQCWTGKDE